MRSGGPKTEAGRAASSRNALKHGLLSETPVLIAQENQQDWEAHRQAMLDSLDARNQAEACLIERAALLLWRLRRVARAEVAVVASERRKLMEYEECVTAANSACGPFLVSLNRLDQLSRYEAHLSRELARAMKALHDLQARPDAAGIEAPPAASENCETNSRFSLLEPENCETNSRSPLPEAENCETNSRLFARGPEAPLASREPAVAVPLPASATIRPLPPEAEAIHRSFFRPPYVNPMPDFRKLFP